MNARLRHFIAILAVCCGGCRQNSTAPVRVLSDLEQNGVFLSGWSVGSVDGDVDKWGSVVYADANYRIQMKLRAVFPDDVLHPITVRVIPGIDGYEVWVLSRSRLSKDQEKSVRLITETAISEAHEAWISKAHRDHK